MYVTGSEEGGKKVISNKGWKRLGSATLRPPPPTKAPKTDHVSLKGDRAHKNSGSSVEMPFSSNPVGRSLPARELQQTQQVPNEPT